MKAKILSLFIIGLLITISSCSKDDDNKTNTAKTYTEENPYATFLTTTKLNEVVEPLDLEEPKEVGYGFSSIVKGQITSISVKIPVENEGLVVTIWDVNTGEPIKTETINVTTADSEITKSITPIPIEKDREYAISMNSQYIYGRSRTDETDISYPVTIGNIKFLGFANFTDQAELPSSIGVGDVSFKFIQVN